MANNLFLREENCAEEEKSGGKSCGWRNKKVGRILQILIVNLIAEGSLLLSGSTAKNVGSTMV
jgi:hypothetical protein